MPRNKSRNIWRFSGVSVSILLRRLLCALSWGAKSETRSAIRFHQDLFLNVGTESESSPELRRGSGGEQARDAQNPHFPHRPAEKFASGRNLLGKGTREVRLIYTFLVFAFLTVQFGMAQTTPASSSNSSSSASSDTGPTAFVQAEGNHFNMGDVLTYDFDLGYKFNEHLSADIGLPLFSTRTPFSVITTVDWRDTTIIGAPYLDVRYDTKHGSTNITTMLTGSAGFNMVKTYSNGRLTAQWFTHFDRPYQVLNYDVIFTPFLNLAAENGSVDNQVMARPFELARPYETLGGLGEGEIGGAFTIHKHYKLEGSAYGLSPVGPQKVFSRLISPDSLVGGDGHHNRFWDQYFETGGEIFNIYGGGLSRISRDNGFGTYLSLDQLGRFRIKNLSVELGYTRSVHYDYGSAFLMLRYNFTGILRSLTVGE